MRLQMEWKLYSEALFFFMDWRVSTPTIWRWLLKYQCLSLQWSGWRKSWIWFDYFLYNGKYFKRMLWINTLAGLSYLFHWVNGIEQSIKNNTLKRKYHLQMGISADPYYKPTTLEQLLFSLKSTFFVAKTHSSFLVNQMPRFNGTIVIWHHDSITKLVDPSHHSQILTCADTMKG